MLSGTLDIHTIELGRYHLQEKDLATASVLDYWIYWMLHAHEYEPEKLLSDNWPLHTRFRFND